MFFSCLSNSPFKLCQPLSWSLILFLVFIKFLTSCLTILLIIYIFSRTPCFSFSNLIVFYRLLGRSSSCTSYTSSHYRFPFRSYLKKGFWHIDFVTISSVCMCFVCMCVCTCGWGTVSLFLSVICVPFTGEVYNFVETGGRTSLVGSSVWFWRHRQPGFVLN